MARCALCGPPTMPSSAPTSSGSCALRLSTLGALAVLVASAITACGGSGHKHGHKSSSTTTTKLATKKPRPTAVAQKAVSESVLAEKGGKSFTTSITVKPSDPVLLKTNVPGNASGRRVRVKLDLQSGPGSSLTVSAAALKHTSTVTLKSANGKPVTLVNIGYVCEMPPAPTFCPARGIASKAGHTTLRFSPPANTPIELNATVGPIPPPKVSLPKSQSLVAPPYRITEAIVAVTVSHKPKHGKPPVPKVSYGQSVTVRPKTSVTLRTAVSGATSGLPQLLTISFDQGPSSMITVTASLQGGRTVQATLHSATGSPITLVLPKYRCLLPPSPTFCPPTKVQAQSNHYTVTFPVSPQTPLVGLSALVQ